MAILLSSDKPRVLERKCRARANVAHFPESIRIIHRVAEFVLRDFEKTMAISGRRLDEVSSRM